MADRPVAVITGGSRGIGKGIALELARLGYDLVIAHYDFNDQGRPDENNALETRKQAQHLEASCEVLRMDVSNVHDRTQLLELTKDRFGRCNMLVNNAGVAPAKRLDLLEATEESFDRVMNINLKGPYFLTQMVANWMIEQKKADPKGGYRIVNTGSRDAERGRAIVTHTRTHTHQSLHSSSAGFTACIHEPVPVFIENRNIDI